MQSNIKDKKDCQADFLVIIQSSNLVLELCIDKTLFEIFEINEPRRTIQYINLLFCYE